MRAVCFGVALVLTACGGGFNPTRYFKVLSPATPAILPDSCYEAGTVAAAMTPDEVAAESFCRVGKKPTSSSSSMTNLVSAQSWTMVQTDDMLYLLVSTGTTPPTTGVEGTVTGTTYSFDAKTTSLTKQCPSGGLAVECNGDCVNRQVDAQNCGTCGNACATGMVCRFGACTTVMCPSLMQVCNGTTTNTQTDDANCGLCGRACMAPQTCSGGVCVDPCQASCSDKYSRAACGMPRQFSRTTETKIGFELKSGSLTGTIDSTTSFDCTAPGCATDFAARCPSCETSSMIFGREQTNVTEFEQR
jgi:hypothetical protein